MMSVSVVVVVFQPPLGVGKGEGRLIGGIDEVSSEGIGEGRLIGGIDEEVSSEGIGEGRLIGGTEDEESSSSFSAWNLTSLQSSNGWVSLAYTKLDRS